MPNRLINESSPYLRQHADNPVDWYPWGEEALERARTEDKPILLSVGYSACHWCHVMEHESFEDEEIARIMNDNFINIKVDREERPDIDSIYMQALQAMTGRGGWPMTVFLTPDGEPFYGGTYFPPDDRLGMPSFRRVLLGVAEGYRTQKDKVVESGQELRGRMQMLADISAAQEPLTIDILHQAQRGLVENIDRQEGGLGAAPKFPQPMTFEFLLRYQRRFKDAQALALAELTLQKMARGGIYDQLGGGFHRYSTDNFWLAPHFEKMLYDNALLSRLYLHAYQATGQPLYRQIVEETLDYLLREMRSPEGGFYSTQDADSEGVEGKFFVWSKREVIEALGQEDGEAFCRYFDVTEGGNWEGHNILHVSRETPLVAAELGISEQQLADVIERGRQTLLQQRQRRVPPARDDKILTAWNGLLLSSLAEAACALGGDDYRQAAREAAVFLLSRLRRQDGRLLRSYKDGVPKLLGYLEDYSFLIDGLLRLHEATFDLRWLEEARTLTEQMLELFWEEDKGFFYDTGTDHETLIVRPRDIFDSATPCGSSVAADVLLRMAVISGEAEYNRIASTALRSVQLFMSKQPSGSGHWLCALDFYLSTPVEIAIIGRREQAEGLLAPVYKGFLPNRVLVGSESAKEGIPLLEDREMLSGRPTAYVCQNYACQQPVDSAEKLAAQLESALTPQ
ncbi:MAG TPA: thioredoxin domain-containing protein [Dehalococcoidia bacterium]|nr:thioredoxin domain-containing protein [Dehalococcoidia bacterium]